ncbi:PCI domain-containing protein 2, partial [Fragariocoptes setiger]
MGKTRALSNAHVGQWMTTLDDAIVARDGETIAELMSLSNANQIDANARKSLGQINASWKDFVEAHLNTVQHLNNGDIVAAFHEKLNSMTLLDNIIKAQRDNMCMALMHRQAVDLRQLAIQADKIDCQRKSYRPDENIEKVCEPMMALFRTCATDSRSSAETSKRRGMIIIINQLFKIYFRINKINLCKPLIRALDNQVNLFHQFSLAQQVTYRYYLGTKSLFDSNIKQAETWLEFAFTNCHPQIYKNKRLILIYLIPVKMLLGHMPTLLLLRHYKLMEFEPIKRAVIAGKVGDLDSALESNSAFFWKYGIYLVLEKLRIIAYRNIFKKVAIAMKTHQIPIDAFLSAVRIVQPDKQVRVEEIHCILANLIYQGKIKGYISLAHQKLVVSKQQPFPPLAEQYSGDVRL